MVLIQSALVSRLQCNCQVHCATGVRQEGAALEGYRNFENHLCILARCMNTSRKSRQSLRRHSLPSDLVQGCRLYAAHELRKTLRLSSRWYQGLCSRRAVHRSVLCEGCAATGLKSAHCCQYSWQHNSNNAISNFSKGPLGAWMHGSAVQEPNGKTTSQLPKYR
jgi:hypothetical protein